MNSKRTKAPLSLSAIACSIILASGQNTFAQSEANKQSRLELEEIVVTAQKRAQSAQDVPITISAFSGEKLSSLGINESEQLGQFVPGLEISTSSGEGSQLILFMRGAGLNDFNTNNAGPIGLYSDEVYISSPALSPFQFFDSERLEILKGPQGTLYGRNTTGGAIKFIANKPTQEFSGRANVRIQNFGTTSFEGALTGPISESLTARFAVVKDDSDGFGTNLVDNTDVNGVDSLAYRGFLDYSPNDNLSVLLNVHGARVDSPTTKFSPLGIIDPNTGGRCSDAQIRANQCLGALGYQSPQDPYQGNYNGNGNVDLEADGGYLQVSYDFENITFTSVTAYDDVRRALPEESDGSPFQVLEVEYGVESETFSQELRLNGSSQSFDWLAGVFYLTEDLEQNQTIDLFGSLRAFTGGLSDPTGSITGAPILFARGLNQQKVDTYAVFGQVTFAVNNDWNLTLGGRYTDETREFNALGQLEDELTFGPQPVPVYNFQDLENSDDAFSYRVALDYTANDSTLIYGSVSRGFKSGGYNGGFLALNPAVAAVQIQPFDSEFLTAYELGVKTDLLDKRLRLNTSLFFNDFSDLQVFTLVNNGLLPIQVLDNASDAETKGLEIEATALLSESLTFSLSAAFMDSELKNFISENANQNFTGNQIANTPKTSLSGILNYEHLLSNGGTLTLQTSFAYKDDLFFSTENNPLVGQEAYTLINARAGYGNPEGDWNITAFANNLTDEEYSTNVSDTTDITSAYVRTLGLPRTYGVEFSFKF